MNKLPEDELTTPCTYDTTSKNTTTYFGWGPDQEMCFCGLIFYPEENVVSILGLKFHIVL